MAYGYIYVTTNTLNGIKYIGKHEKDKYDPSYYGSGKYLLEDIAKYGIENFVNEPIAFFNSADELNKAEIHFINEYRRDYSLYNVAAGGNGGNVWRYASEIDKEKFSKKMSIVNSFRTYSKEFREKTSKRMHEKYLSEDERKKQSEIVKQAWSNPVLKKEQSERLKNFYANKKRDCSFNNKKMKLVFNGQTITFKSRAETRKYFKETFNVSLCSETIKTIVEESINGDGWHPFHKNKYANLTGLKLFYIEDVETNHDECSDVSGR